MKIILFFFMLIIGLILLSFVFVGTLLSRLFGKRRTPQDLAVIQSLSALSPAEKAILAHSIQRDDPVIGILSDQSSIDSLMAKGVIVQSEGPGGIIDYRVADAPWSVLRRTRGL